MSSYSEVSPWLLPKAGLGSVDKICNFLKFRCFEDAMAALEKSSPGECWSCLEFLLVKTCYDLKGCRWFLDYMLSKLEAGHWEKVGARKYCLAVLQMLKRSGLSQESFDKLWRQRNQYQCKSEPLLYGKVLARVSGVFPDFEIPKLDTPVIKGMLMELAKIYPEGNTRIFVLSTRVDYFFYLRYCVAKYMCWYVIENEIVPELRYLSQEIRLNKETCSSGQCGYKENGCDKAVCNFVALLIAVMTRSKAMYISISGHANFDLEHIPLVFRELRGVVRAKSLPVILQIAKMLISRDGKLDDQMAIQLMGYLACEQDRVEVDQLNLLEFIIGNCRVPLSECILDQMYQMLLTYLRLGNFQMANATYKMLVSGSEGAMDQEKIRELLEVTEEVRCFYLNGKLKAMLK